MTRRSKTGGRVPQDTNKIENFLGQIWTSQQISQLWGGGPTSWKFSESKNPHKINFSSLQICISPDGGGVAPGHMSQTETH